MRDIRKRLEVIPEAIRTTVSAIWASENPVAREDLSIFEAEWAHQTLQHLFRPVESIPDARIVIVGGVALKIYCEWETGRDKRHGKPIVRKTPDLDCAAMLSDNRIARAEKTAKKHKIGFEYSGSKDRIKVTNFNDIGMDVNARGMIGKCIDTADAYKTANDFVLGKTPVKVISEPYFVISKMSAAIERGHREKDHQDEADITTMVYVRYGSIKAFISDNKVEETLLRTIEKGRAANFGVHCKDEFLGLLRNAIATTALSGEAPLSIMRAVARDSTMEEIRESLVKMIKQKGTELHLSRVR